MVAGSIPGLGDAVAAERDCGLSLASSVRSAKARGTDSKPLWLGGVGVPALNGESVGCVGLDNRARFDSIVCRSVASIADSLHAKQASTDRHCPEASNMRNAGQTDLPRS